MNTILEQITEWLKGMLIDGMVLMLPLFFLAMMSNFAKDVPV